mmetsp:Transcript_14075/g.52822  ORF Transcript_14075/g.52822 Transcript_14075/m.52822 type:complete len:378 (+) Transcript_14075:919-2052(+)
MLARRALPLMLLALCGSFGRPFRRLAVPKAPRGALSTCVVRSSSSDANAAGVRSGPELPSDWNGLICVDKPVGWTSSDVVVRVRRIIEQYFRSRGVKLSKRSGVKVGHGGTLDPLASGCLVLGVGEGCKYMKDFLAGAKSYEAIALFGVETDTLDSTGKVTNQTNVGHVTEEAIKRAAESFLGDSMQLPPVYSALKRGGEPLYAKARRGEDVEHLLEPRPVTIYGLDVLDCGDKATAPELFDVPSMKEVMNFWEGDWLCQSCGKKNFAKRDVCFSCKAPRPEESADEPCITEHSHQISSKDGAPLVAAKIHVSCSGGFYVRSLIRDLGHAVDSGAHMTALRRVRQGRFSVEKSLPQDDWNWKSLYKSTLVPKSSSKN